MIWMTVTRTVDPLSVSTFGLCLGFAIPYFQDIPWTWVQKASRVIARYSYGIYLSHFVIQCHVYYIWQAPRLRFIPPIHHLLRFNRPVNVALVLVLTAAASLALYHFIEVPGIRLGQKLARWMTGPRRAPSGAVAYP